YNATIEHKDSLTSRAGAVAPVPPNVTFSNAPRRVVVLGSTGSVGTNCLDVIACLPERLEVIGLSAHNSADALVQQAQQFRPRWITLTDPDTQPPPGVPPGTQVLRGVDGIRAMVSDPDVDVVVVAIVGAAG